MVGHSAGELFLGHGQRRPVETQTPHITTWDGFFQALRECFYPPGYRQNLLADGCSSDNLPINSVQGYIDIFCKLRIQLHIVDPEEVLIIKFNSGLLIHLHCEVDLFESSSLDKAFLRALVVECKVAPRTRSPQAQDGPSNVSTSPTIPSPGSHASPTSPHNATWCTFHKTNSHASVDCQALQNLFPNKTLFVEVTQLIPLTLLKLFLLKILQKLTHL
jgi:hypothetical protein